jgi:outer membrane receptor protein involved in Fe transport
MKPLAFAVAMVLAPAAEAFAQQPAALEEVVVTATKREQPLQEVPLAVTALTADEIETRGLSDFADYLTSVPGVQYNYGGNPLNQSISIRGVTDGSGSTLTQTPVAIYVDEMPVTLSQGASNLDFGVYDVEQISVLRGPHGTLYGAAALGGTIKIQTRSPRLDRPEARVSGTYSSTSSGGDNYEARASLSTPVGGDEAAVGITGFHRDMAGFIDSPSRGLRDINGERTTGGRLALAVAPTEALRIDAKVYYQKYELDNPNSYSPSVGDLKARPTVTDEPFADEFKAGTLTIRYDFGGAVLTAATSYFDRDTTTSQDVTGLFGPLLGLTQGTIANNTDVLSKVLAQEVRLVSDADQGMTWVVGAFFSDEDTREISSTPAPFIGELFGAVGDYSYRQYAAFAEIGYRFANSIELTGGMRWTDYESVSDVDLSGVFFAGLPDVRDFRFSESPVTPRFALAYRPGDTTYYLQASKGFRLGQVNIPVAGPPGFVTPPFYRSDSLWNYEAGVKSSLLDRRVTANLAAYHIDWDDVQLTLENAFGLQYIANAGKVRVNGAELELNARAMEQLMLSASVAYTESELAQTVTGVAEKGTRMPGVPKTTIAAAVQYDLRLGATNTVLRADYRNVGESKNTFGADAVDIGGYGVLDLRTTVEFGAWSLGAYLQNATDERARLSYSRAFGEQVATIRPRTIGITVGYRL